MKRTTGLCRPAFMFPAAPLRTESVERHMDGGDVQPGGRLGVASAPHPDELRKNLLRHILGVSRVPRNSVSHRDDARILSREEVLKSNRDGPSKAHCSHHTVIAPTNGPL